METVEETEWLLSHDPTIQLVFDTGHLLYASRGQADLVDLLHKWKARIGTFHFKDIDAAAMAASEREGSTYLEAVKHHGLCVNLGQGMVDFPGLVEAQRETGYQGFVCVEQETFDWTTAGSDMARNHRYLSTLYQGPARCAILGTGRMGAIHATNLAANPHWDLQVVIDADADRARQCGEAVSAASAASIAAASEQSPELQAVFICHCQS